MHRQSDRQRVLARVENGMMESCECGVIHLHFGSVTLRLQEDALRMLAELINKGLADLELTGFGQTVFGTSTEASLKH